MVTLMDVCGAPCTISDAWGALIDKHTIVWHNDLLWLVTRRHVACIDIRVPLIRNYFFILLRGDQIMILYIQFGLTVWEGGELCIVNRWRALKLRLVVIERAGWRQVGHFVLTDIPVFPGLILHPSLRIRFLASLSLSKDFERASGQCTRHGLSVLSSHVREVFELLHGWDYIMDVRLRDLQIALRDRSGPVYISMRDRLPLCRWTLRLLVALLRVDLTLETLFELVLIGWWRTSSCPKPTGGLVFCNRVQ